MTRDQLPARVLLHLGALDPFETPEQAISDAILAEYDAAWAQLAEENLISWGSLEPVPGWAELPVLAVVAEHYRPALGKGPTDYSAVLSAKNTLRRLEAGQYAPSVNPPTWF